jgi:preprotein translocase subunit SecY
VLTWLSNAWRVPELRRRVLFTAMILAVYRFGSWMPAPGIDSTAIKNYFSQGGVGSSVLGLLNLFSGSALSRFSVFALGIMPYVTASIILQLLAVVVPRLEQLQKEGEAGYAKINQYTRYLTVALAALQSLGYVFLFTRTKNTSGSGSVLNTNSGRIVLIVVTLTAGTALLMWMGELITKRGIGNGISIIIFASIIADAPTTINSWLNGGATTKLFYPILIVAVVAAVVFVQEGQRRIPVQYARRMVGRRMSGGGSTYMPLRVNMAGVIPIIFAAALLAFPPTVAQFFPATQGWINRNFQPHQADYLLTEAFLIIVFTYFYTAVQFNPVDQADNLRKYGGYIPGIRPGPPTAQYLDRVLSRLTLPGSLFLAFIAVFPTYLGSYFNLTTTSRTFLGGTSLLIMVGVALDTMRQMESQMMMRSYEGFLDRR